MNEFEKSAAESRRRHENAAESRELFAESKERQAEAAEKVLGAKERIEVTHREAKSTKQQIQNIVANMQQVVAAVAAIRAQLGVSNNAAIPSVASDQKKLEQLKFKLAKLNAEIGDLKNALLAEELKATRAEAPNVSEDKIKIEAERRVADILNRLGIEN